MILTNEGRWTLFVQETEVESYVSMTDEKTKAKIPSAILAVV